MSEDRSKTAAKPAAEAAARKPARHPPRPVKGPVDFDALYKKITTRFRKTLARLAE